MPKRKFKTIRGIASVRNRAKELRQRATPAEKILLEQLRGRRLLGLKFRLQHPIDTYIVDFYCPAHCSVVEFEGEIHQYQGEIDQTRTDQLDEKGYKVIRFWNYEVENQLDIVLKTIEDICNLPSPRAGRRAWPERSEGGEDEGANDDLA
jgi:very-short-patch-repair endonuclease